MEVSINLGTPIAGWCWMVNEGTCYWNGWFRGSPICRNTQLWSTNPWNNIWNQFSEVTIDSLFMDCDIYIYICMYIYIYKYLLIFPLILVINPTMDNWSIIYYQFIITNEFLSYMINISDTYISIYIYQYIYVYIHICTYI